MDLVGKKIGKLQVIEKCGPKSNGKERTLKIYKCLCDCGKEEMLSREQLTRNQTPACSKCARKLRFIDLIGKIFGKWSVIKLYDSGDYKVTRWKCLCECGNEKNIIGSSLTSGKSTSCGCEYKEKDKTKINLIGQKFGKLLVIGKSDKKSFWKCLCDCGNEKIVYSSSLYSGASKSCGCLRKEMMSGENSRFWEGGYDVELRNGRLNSAIDSWSKKIRKRDKLCQMCNSNEKLHAHHIINYIFDPSKSLDLDNGITLCEECHKLFHKTYGKKENNIEQLNEFLKWKTN